MLSSAVEVLDNVVVIVNDTRGVGGVMANVSDLGEVAVGLIDSLIERAESS